MHSIRFRFIAFLALLLVVLLLLLNTYPVIYSRDAVFQEKHSSMSGQAALLAASLSGLERLNYPGIAEVLTFLDLSGYERVTVVDANGAVLFDSGGDPSAPEDLLRALEGRTVFRSRFNEAAFLSTLSMPMSDQGKLSGAVFLQERDSERAQGIWAVQRHLRTVSLTIGAAALVIAGLFVLLITRRIDALVSSLRTVAGGNFRYRHSIRGRDEISELGQELNQLTERLETNEAERRRFVADASHELKRRWPPSVCSQTASCRARGWTPAPCGSSWPTSGTRPGASSARPRNC